MFEFWPCWSLVSISSSFKMAVIVFYLTVERVEFDNACKTSSIVPDVQ